ncbi:replication endonuclease [Agarivorans sp. 1_MG-2023]|uniref:replication endonuclease n=1 Tax=Agarivorans sp. 1_MG-2023 TaxID=3062634 RepID=UPI0026E2E17E|nr:replication endonuclease [Agarivorans sp. 1_MG-2023]MDO6763708.1 replication endonuclease [Agarivorans sp. 1_MG-2023]
MPVPEQDDKAYVLRILASFPTEFRMPLMAQYHAAPTKRDANIGIRTIRDNVAKAIGAKPISINLDLCEEDLRKKATEKADNCTRLTRLSNSPKAAYEDIAAYIRGKGIKPPIPRILLKGEIDTAYTESDTYKGAINRTKNSGWWLRKLRQKLNQDIEATAQHLSLVNKRKQIYCSNITLNRRTAQLAYQDKLMSSSFVINDAGQRYSLKELSDLNVSNPEIRRQELMVRARGFQELAEEHKHVGLFLTLTCPSKYHSSYGTTGHRNAKWDGSLPKDGQHYLRDIYAKIRAQLDRDNIKPYGIRVAEPHHDGTPHWHLLVFVAPEQKQRMLDIYRHYAFQEDGDEKGADLHRFKAVEIDPNKGSAAGYLAKYVSKNINGKSLESGIHGEEPIEAAARVNAWAACWRIRQFQQVGGASVTVWRELRRLKKVCQFDETIQQAFTAADTANWKEFTKVMGGVWCKLANRPLRVYYQQTVDTETGECKTNAYGDVLVKRLKGVLYQGLEIVTRHFEWQVVRGSSSSALLGVL